MAGKSDVKTEAEVRARVQRLINLRAEIIRLSNGRPDVFNTSVAAIDASINQLSWVLGEDIKDEETPS